MTRRVIAEYDAAANALRLDEPLPDVEDREMVRVSVETSERAPAASIRDALARLGSLHAPTADIEQMLAVIEAGRH